MEILEARALLRPTPVNLHHIPRWFLQALRPFRKRFGGRLESPFQGFENMRNALGGGQLGNAWLDHFGSTKLVRRHAGRERITDETVFVSEPYGLTPGGTLALAELTRLTGIRWSVESNSWWYPGHTIRIVFEPPTPTA